MTWPVQWLRGLASLLVSLLVHVVLLLVMAILLVPTQRRVPIEIVTTAPSQAATFELAGAEFHELEQPVVDLPVAEDRQLRSPAIPDLPALGGSAAQLADLQPRWLDPRHGEALLQRTFAPTGGGLEGRDPQMRALLVGRDGGTAASEEAVEMGLRWLAAHQRQDGSWRFNHLQSNCDGTCRHPGEAATTTGATALALLPFLGAGYTSEHGPYRDVVQRGLYYLSSRMLVTSEGGDLQEGTMYAQGLAALALCEGYAMTGDEQLQSTAQQAIDFICHAQHAQGGWRYVPGQPGDTTVFGWQIMALKSATMAGLHVPSPVIEAAMSYLDSVQAAEGATYGYQRPGKDPAPTAIGLLSRMYYGWRQNDPRLHRGVMFLDQRRPSKNDMYFNYYATQVMHHHGGKYWTKWNNQLRDYLVATQAQVGHERGSWYFPDKHGDVGGRLYNTAMCIMILEVYYRHMPLYEERSVGEGW